MHSNQYVIRVTCIASSRALHRFQNRGSAPATGTGPFLALGCQVRASARPQAQRNCARNLTPGQDLCILGFDTRQKLTWPFVTLKAVIWCSRLSSKAGIGMIAGKNIPARRRCSPVTGIDCNLFQRDRSASAKGMKHRIRAHRHQGWFLEGATIAYIRASVAGGRIGVSRLPHAAKTRTATGQNTDIRGSFDKNEALRHRCDQNVSMRRSWPECR